MDDAIVAQLMNLNQQSAATTQAVLDLTHRFDVLIPHVRELDVKTEAMNVKIETTAAASDATSSQKAKMWAAVGAGISIALGIAGDWLLFGRH